MIFDLCIYLAEPMLLHDVNSAWIKPMPVKSNSHLIYNDVIWYNIHKAM